MISIRNLWLAGLAAPLAAHAHPAPFAHTHGFLDVLDHPLAVVSVLAVVALVAWIALRDRH